MKENEVLGCAKETRSSKAVPKEQCLSQGMDGKVGERELLERLCRNPEGDWTLKQKGKHKAIDALIRQQIIWRHENAARCISGDRDKRIPANQVRAYSRYIMYAYSRSSVVSAADIGFSVWPVHGNRINRTRIERNAPC